MKYIGFIREEDKNIPDAKSFTELFLDIKNDPLINEKIIGYLGTAD